MMFVPSLTQVIPYVSVQVGPANTHDDVEQHSSEPKTNVVKIDVAAPARAALKSTVVPFRTIVLVHVRTNDVPHGDPLIEPSVPIMHSVPWDTLLHPALAPCAKSHGS